MLKHSQTLGMFSNRAMKNILLCGENFVRVDGDRFHHQVGGVPENSAAESSAHQVSYSAFILLGNLHMDNLSKLSLGLVEEGARVDRGAAKGGPGALVDLEPSQIVCHLKPKVMGRLSV